jgi:hypothetical protein
MSAMIVSFLPVFIHNKILTQRRKGAKILIKFIFVFLCGLCAFA